jgi:hypothetical protein
VIGLMEQAGRAALHRAPRTCIVLHAAPHVACGSRMMSPGDACDSLNGHVHVCAFTLSPRCQQDSVTALCGQEWFHVEPGMWKFPVQPRRQFPGASPPHLLTFLATTSFPPLTATLCCHGISYHGCSGRLRPHPSICPHPDPTLGPGLNNYFQRLHS